MKEKVKKPLLRVAVYFYGDGDVVVSVPVVDDTGRIVNTVSAGYGTDSDEPEAMPDTHGLSLAIGRAIRESKVVKEQVEATWVALADPDAEHLATALKKLKGYLSTHLSADESRVLLAALET